MPSDKRQRQDEGRLLRLEAQRSTQQHDQRKRQFRTLAMIVGGVLVMAGGFAIFNSDPATDVSTGSSTTTTPAGDTVVLPQPGKTITGDTPCPAADGSAERATTFAQAPPMCIDPAKTYTATLVTSAGDIEIQLDATNAPQTVNNFVVLSRYHFYDDVPFHRIVPGFVNQAGDPIGPTPGNGGPGYTIPDELPKDPATAYPAGTVAMANRSPEPNSGGSQFFLVIGDEGGALSGAGSYSVFGKIVKGQDVSEAINKLAGPEDKPIKPVTIESVTITEA